MQHASSIALLALLTVVGLSACDRPGTVVSVPATPIIVESTVPGPAGPQGETGKTGATGGQGESTAVIIMPPASAPAN